MNTYLEAFLDLAAMNPDNRPFHQLSPTQARETFELSSQRMRWSVPTHLEVHDHRLATRDGAALTVREYRQPSQAGQTLPVIAYFHGGGYVVGSLDSHDGVCRELAARTGCAVLGVGYRLAPEHRFPTAFEDGEDMLLWLCEHGSPLGLDASTVIIAGDSAGATLAAALAIRAVQQPFFGLGLKGQLLCYPVTDASGKRSSHTVFGEGYLLEDETLDWFYGHYARTDADREDWRFSPLLAESLEGVAPAIVLLAGLDPLLDEGRAYAERLRSAGVDVQCLLEPGLTHDLLRLVSIVPQVTQVYDQLVAGVGQWLPGVPR